MKRNFRRFANIATATLLAACITAPMATGLSSSAAGKITITGVEDNVAHKYTLYQIFAGTVDTANINTPGTLGSLNGVKWAWEGDADAADKTSAFITALNGGNLTGWTALDTDAKAAAVAEAINTWITADSTTTEAKTKELAQLLGDNNTLLKEIGTDTDGSFENVADGYYIIVESDLANTVDGSMTYHLLGTYNDANDVEVSVKASKPSVIKKVKENVKYTEDKGFGAGYNDVADYTKGAMVPFKLIATLPSNIDVYDNYYIKYTDTLDAGFDAPTALKVTIDGVEGKVFEVAINEGSGTADDGNIQVTVTGSDEAGWEILVGVINVQKYKPADGSLKATTVTVDYEAKFDTDAIVGKPGNYNDVYLTYSNNPNNTGDGATAPSDTGQTDKDGVVVFTYVLDVYKYDGADTNKALLDGAEFVLSNEAGEYLSVDADNVYTWVTVDTTGADFDWADVTNVTKFTSTTSEVISISGLDDGTYYLTETVAPDGYNILENPVELVITADTANSQDQDAIGPNADTDDDGKGDGRNGDQLTSITLTKDGDTADTNNDAADDTAGGTVLTEGNVQVEIANNSGTQLPGTGGIGTTLFYLGGGAMVAIGGIYLISKKRANGAQE